MFDQHILTAVQATREELENMGVYVTDVSAGAIFREAANLWSDPTIDVELWEGYDTWLDEQADRHSYELSMEGM